MNWQSQWERGLAESTLTPEFGPPPYLQSPDDVYREVRERIDIFNLNGGFVCNAVHNIQGNSPIENVLAMFRAIKDSAQ